MHEVVTVLSGDVAGSLLDSLKSEVDTLVEQLRLEVAVGAEQHSEREVEKALQVCSVAKQHLTQRHTLALLAITTVAMAVVMVMTLA